MAKKKSTELTLEEKLEQALVPVEEQPYEVPENWCWVRQSTLCGLADGEKKTGEEYPYLEVKYLRGNKEAELVDKGKFIKSGTKVILVDGENSGEVFSVGESGYMGSTFKELIINNRASSQYIQLFIDSKKMFYRNNKKGSAIPHLNKELFFTMPLPLPPLAEQQRIVDRIESLFAKLDEAKDKVQAVLDESENRKAAILHKAFSGELTAKWREDNCITDEWDSLEFENCIYNMQNGLSKRSGNDGTETAVLRLANLGDERIIRDDLREIRLTTEEFDKYSLLEGDILMIRVNGSKSNVGKLYYVTDGYKEAFCDHIIRMKVRGTVIEPQYLIYYSRTETYRKYISDNMVSSAGQNTISRKGMQGLRVPLASVKEQKYVVELLDRLSDHEKQVVDVAMGVIEDIEIMKKSVLAQAFYGELGTNSPDEESAEELLKSILERED